MPTRDLAALVRSTCESLGVSPTQPMLVSLVQWLELIERWNQRIDLTAAKTDHELVDIAVADAAVLSAQIGQSQTVVDVGAGAGAPGLALAILRPDLSITLVEPLRKRVAFLRTAIGTVELDVEVMAHRGQQLEQSEKRWDVAMSRATMKPQDWLRLGACLTHHSGGLVALFTAGSAHEGAAGASGDDRMERLRLLYSVDYEWPLTKKPRSLSVFETERNSQTLG